jgi:lysophospholipase
MAPAATGRLAPDGSMPAPFSLPGTLFPPPGGEAFPAHDVMMLTTRDGYRLRAAFFPALAGIPPKGTVLLLQGRAEFIEKYGEVIGELLERGFAVMSFDWRGQGGSERLLVSSQIGHVEDFDDFLTDLECVIATMTARALPQPWSLLAHSTGGCLALLHLAEGASPFRRAVLTAPLIGIAGKGGGALGQWLSRVLSALGLATWRIPFGTEKPRMAGAFEGNIFTRDAARFAGMKAWLDTYPALALGDPSIGWVAAAFHALERFAEEDFGHLSRTPVLMLLAGADTVVETRAAEALALRLRATRAILLPHARHEILMETDEIRSLFWAAFDAFVPGEDI